MGSKSVTNVATYGTLVTASGALCDSALFSLEIAVSTKLLTSDGTRTKTSVSLISLVAVVGLQGRVVVIGQAHVVQAINLTRVARVLMPNPPRIYR